MEKIRNNKVKTIQDMIEKSKGVIGTFEYRPLEPLESDIAPEDIGDLKKQIENITDIHSSIALVGDSDGKVWAIIREDIIEVIGLYKIVFTVRPAKFLRW